VAHSEGSEFKPQYRKKKKKKLTGSVLFYWTMCLSLHQHILFLELYGMS
jgi:hypothetical protein